MARGKIKSTSQRIAELEAEMRRLKAQQAVEDIKPIAEKALKKCLDKDKVMKVIEILDPEAAGTIRLEGDTDTQLVD